MRRGKKVLEATVPPQPIEYVIPSHFESEAFAGIGRKNNPLYSDDESEEERQIDYIALDEQRWIAAGKPEKWDQHPKAKKRMTKKLAWDKL